MPVEDMRRKVLWVAILVLLVSCVGIGTLFTLYSPSRLRVQEGGRAAIVDGLAETLPNEAFIREASSYLEEAGFDVDVYSGRSVNVEFFKRFPPNYAIVILRTHSAPEAIFTTERYDQNRYLYEQITEQLYIGEIRYLPKGNNTFFALTDKFIVTHMEFSGTIIIQMGCWGVSPENRMKDAFFEKGASAYIGWLRSVSIDRSDTAIASFLKNLLIDDATLEEAVNAAMKIAGPDREDDSVLMYFPKTLGDHTLRQILALSFEQTSGRSRSIIGRLACREVYSTSPSVIVRSPARSVEHSANSSPWLR